MGPHPHPTLEKEHYRLRVGKATETHWFIVPMRRQGRGLAQGHTVGW